MTPPTMATMPSKGSPKEIVRLSETTRAALIERAKTEGVSKSEIMRRAIERELTTTPEPNKAAPTAGSNEGESDDEESA